MKLLALIKTNFCVIISLLFHTIAVGQDNNIIKTSKKDLYADGIVHYGFIVPHHKAMQHLTRQHFTCYELNISEKAHGKKLWEQLYNYPYKGIGLLYSSLGNNPYTGKAFAVFPYMNFRLTQGNRVYLLFRMAIGLGYLTKKFDAVHNYKNIAIGTHLNAFIQLKFEAKTQITQRLFFNTGISLSHFSNGSFKVPNLGINLLTVNAGLSYRFFKNPPQLITQEIPSVRKKWLYSIYGKFGINELYAAGGKKYPAVCFTAYFTKPINLKNHIGIAIDVFYNEALVEYLRRRDVVLKSKAEAIRPAVSFVHSLNFSAFSFISQAGVYLYTKDNTDGYIFDRIALQYAIKNHYLIKLGLKTHWFKAEMIEMGLGYRF